MQLFKLKALPEEEVLDGASRASFDPFGFVLAVWQIVLMVFWGFVVEFGNYDYPNAAQISAEDAISDIPGAAHNDLLGLLVQGYRGYELRLDNFYTFYTHIAMMVFLGFGLVSAFMKKYGFTSLGYTLLFGVIAWQWGILNNGFWWNVNVNARDESKSFDMIKLTFDVVINGMYGAAAVIVTLGVLIGKAKPLELFIITVLEVMFYSFNRYICLLVLEAVDLGGAMVIHMFGAYFGLAASVFVSRPYAESIQKQYQGRQPDELGSTHTSDLLALIGTIIVWVFFPSFNGALAPNGTQYRAVINTILGLASSTVFTFLISRTFRRRLFDIRDVQNASLAGGVALASVHNILIQPGAALLVGAVAAAMAMVGFVWIQPFLERKSPIKVFDTRGIHNVHGIPGLIGGLAGIVAAAISDDRVYNQDTDEFLFRGIPEQGGFQAAAFGTSFGIALGAGLVVGLLIFAIRKATKPMNTDWYSDEVEFVVPTDYETKYYTPVPQKEDSQTP
jgi:ammonium transporter Rh